MSTRVSLFLHDDGPHYDAAFIAGLWNGFAMPWFTKEVADQIAADIDKDIAEAGGDAGLVRVVWDEDKQAFSDIDPNYPDDPPQWWPTMPGDGVVLHGIGAGSWTWQFSDDAEDDDEDEDLGCEGHESLAGEHMGESVYCDGSCRKYEKP